MVGTSFRVHLANGRTLAGEELVGATLSVVVPGGTSQQQVRANYCGDHGTTRDGMPIDASGSPVVLDPDVSPEFEAVHFEAAWTPDGAVCVAHTRVPQELSLEQLAGGCPRLSGRLGDARCSEVLARATEPAALIFNRSVRQAPAGA